MAYLNLGLDDQQDRAVATGTRAVADHERLLGLHPGATPANPDVQKGLILPALSKPIYCGGEGGIPRNFQKTFAQSKSFETLLSPPPSLQRALSISSIRAKNARGRTGRLVEDGNWFAISAGISSESQERLSPATAPSIS